MEHILVNFPVSRTVLIDGEESGKTNSVLRVEEGMHTFSLDGPHDYMPVSRTVNIKDTSPIKSGEVTTFKLSAESVDRLRAVGAKLLTASPDYQKLLKDLK
jgi:hypothetical protein